ncbi:hypothetical protein AUJ62_01850 [Candidatus Pacearchaeota archaeon CG1_02_32_21]|nr:MAG: hypothetical protein AUJ62_01850 [Candidatus Pacearchaeota archaeon CG1_02_32_21]
MLKKQGLEYIRKGKGVEIARHFFREYTTASKISKNVYSKTVEIYKRKTKKSSWSMPLVNEFSIKWRKLGYFSTAIFPQEYRRYGKTHYETRLHYMLNLYPLFDFYKEEINSEGFTESEKSILTWIFYPINTRREILDLYSKDIDIITAIMKFYMGVLFIPSLSAKRRIILRRYKNRFPSRKFFQFLATKIVQRGDTKKLNVKQYKTINNAEALKVKEKENSFEYYLSKNHKFIELYESSSRAIYTKKNNTTELVAPHRKFDSFYLAHYLYLHECLPKIMKELDKKMLQALGIYFEY